MIAYSKIIFLIYQSKHKEGSFEHPKHILNLMCKEIINIVHLKKIA